MERSIQFDLTQAEDKDMTERRCRWGIMGTAEIARKNWDAIKNSGHQLTAVASRTTERAAEYIAENQEHVAFSPAPTPCGSYGELLERDDVDAVYIPLPTGLRKEWVIAAAKAGKHVLCEKPCASTTDDLKEMIKACADANVQFMDGVMFMHSGRMDAMRNVIDDGESIGEMKRITSQFSFRAPQDFIEGNIRVNSELEPHGALGDLGWYNVRFALWAMKYAMPHTVIGRELNQYGRGDSPSPVPMEFSGELLFDGGVSAGFYCSFLTEHQQWANISGTKGYLRLTDFVLPFYGCESAFDVSRSIFDFNGCDYNMRDHVQRHAVKEYSNNAPGAQESNLFGTFSELALSGKPDPSWADISLKTQTVIDCLLQSARNGSEPISI